MTPYELEERADGSVSERKSYVPVVASVSSALMFGAVAFWSVSISGGGSLAGGSPLVTVDTAAPNAPNISLVTSVIDSITFRVNGGPFSGSQGDSHDSTRTLVDSAGGDFTSPLVDSVTGPQTEDTISFAAQANAVYDFVMLYRGEVGGWSDTSSVSQHTVSFSPGKITTLSVVGQADDSLKLQWVTVHNGKGLKAHHQSRYKNITGDTASFAWGGSQESTSEAFDSLGTNIGDTVSLWITGLTSGDTYEFGVITYRDDEGDGDPFTGQGFVYGAVPATGSGTTTGTTTSSPSQDTTDTPTLSLSATSDTSNIQMNGSGFVGGAQSHDSTRWRLDNNSDMSSPFHDVTSAVDLTSHLVTDNANLTAGSTYYGTVQYFGSLDASAVSSIQSVVNAAPGGACGGVGEPAGFTVVRTHDGTAIELSGWTEALSGPSSHSIEDTVPSAPDGDNTIYRRTYPEGMSMNGAGTDFVFTSGGLLGGTEVFFKVWFRPDADWLGHPSTVNKLLYWGSGGSGQQNVMFALMHGSGTGTLRMEVRRQFPSPAGVYLFSWNDGANLASPTASQASISRGAWNELRVWQRANTPGNADGDLKYWLNGVLIGDFEGFEFFNGSNTRGWKNDGIYGGSAAGTLSQTQTMDYDDICISVLN